MQAAPTAASGQASGQCQAEEQVWGSEGRGFCSEPRSLTGPLEARTELTHFPTQGKKPAGSWAGRVGALCLRHGVWGAQRELPYGFFSILGLRFPGL